MSDLLEAVHVQLPDEGCKVMMFKVGGEYFFCESGDVFDDEGITCCGPADYLFDLFILCWDRCTSTISRSLPTKVGTWVLLFFLFRFLFINFYESSQIITFINLYTSA